MSQFRDATRGLSARRIGAMMMRYIYLLRSSWPRLLELLYWPTVQMVTWGFLQNFITQSVPGDGSRNAITIAGGALMGAMLLWDILMRGQLGFSIGFLEEMWSRNIGNLMMSPLRPVEFVIALALMSIVRLCLSMLPVTLLAIAFFGYNLWSLGFAVGAFFFNLMLTAWSVGLVVCGIVLRNGMGAEGLVWGIIFLLMPFSAVYYPVAVLPFWMQWIAWALPPAYVFEGLRAASVDHVFRADLMGEAFAINIVVFLVSIIVFLRLVDAARRNGSLMQMGE